MSMEETTLLIRINRKGTYHFVLVNSDNTCKLFLTDRIRDWDTAKTQAECYSILFLLRGGVKYDLDTPKEFNVA